MDQHDRLPKIGTAQEHYDQEDLNYSGGGKPLLTEEPYDEWIAHDDEERGWKTVGQGRASRHQDVAGALLVPGIELCVPRQYHGHPRCPSLQEVVTHLEA